MNDIKQQVGNILMIVLKIIVINDDTDNYNSNNS